MNDKSRQHRTDVNSREPDLGEAEVPCERLGVKIKPGPRGPREGGHGTAQGKPCLSKAELESFHTSSTGTDEESDL